MAPDLEGQVATVTGGASGICPGIARRLAQSGVTVIPADLSLAAAKQAAEAMVAEWLRAAPFAIHVSDEAMVDTGVADIAARFGPVDILVSTAGIQIVHSIQD